LEPTGFTLEGRVLCSDEACIGTIGPDRCCKVCGKAYEGNESLDGPDPDAMAPPTKAADEAAEAADESSSEWSYDPAERECCTDESCIGIIGENGVCGTCGKSR
jgi:hypothetical protein